VWDDVDMPPADPDLNFSFENPAARAAGEKEKEDKIQALLRAKEERDKEKEETEKRAKKQASVRQVDWPEDTVRQGEEIGERTTGRNIINPQAQQAALNGNNEEKGEEVVGPDARNHVMTDAPPMPSILKRKEEDSIPNAPLEESQDSKKLRKSLEKKKKREAKQEAKRSASATARNLQEALASVGRKSESQTKPPLPSVRARAAAVGFEKGNTVNKGNRGTNEEPPTMEREDEMPQPQADPQPKVTKLITPPPGFQPLSITEIKTEPPTTPVLPFASKPAPSPEEVDEIPQSNSPTKEAHELLNSPPPARQESPLASPLTNQALAQINPTRALDESTQTDFTTPNSTEENWEVTFLTSGYVRVEITVRESNGQLRQPTELLMPEGECFNRPWAERCNFFRFQLGRLPTRIWQLSPHNRNRGKYLI
jgi:hypothetical protein